MVLLSPESDQPIDLFKPKTEARFIRWSETLPIKWSSENVWNQFDTYQLFINHSTILFDQLFITIWSIGWFFMIWPNEKNSPTTRFPWNFWGFPLHKTTIWRPRSCEVGRKEFDQFKALLRETNIVGLGQHGLDKTIRQCTCCVGWSHPIIGPPASWELLLMDKILHHLGWLKPYE